MWSKSSGYEYDGDRQWLDWVIFDETKYSRICPKDNHNTLSSEEESRKDKGLRLNGHLT